MITKEQKDEWVKALRSGEYRQCVRRLKNGGSTTTFCCLGVARELFPSDAPSSLDGRINFDFLDEDYQSELICLNDVRTPFPEIADWIEKHVPAENKARNTNDEVET